MNSTLRKILFGSLRVRTSSGDINASFLVAIQANSKCMEEVEEESSGKRPHVSTGNTPHKPDDNASVADRLVRFPQGEKVQRNLTSQRVQQIL